MILHCPPTDLRFYSHLYSHLSPLWLFQKPFRRLQVSEQATMPRYTAQPSLGNSSSFNYGKVFLKFIKPVRTFSYSEVSAGGLHVGPDPRTSFIYFR